MRLPVLILLVAVLSAGAVAMAPGATGCSDGPAHAASAARPHTFDPVGDTYYAPDDQVDVRAAWVGVHSTPSGDPVYTAHLAVSAVHDGSLPGGTFYGLGLLDTTVGAWVAADGSVEFGQWGVWATGPFVDDVGVAKLRDLPGTIDRHTGIISVQLPDDVAPAAGEVATTQVWPRTGRGESTQTGLGMVDEVVVTLDASQPDGRCTAVLDGLPADADS